MNPSDSTEFLNSDDYTMASQLIDSVLTDTDENLQTFIKKNMHNVRERTVSIFIIWFVYQLIFSN